LNTALEDKRFKSSASFLTNTMMAVQAHRRTEQAQREKEPLPQTIKYILTDIGDDDPMVYSHRASEDRTLEMLGFGEEGAHAATFVVNDCGNLVQITTDIDGRYGGYWGSLSRSASVPTNICEINEAMRHIQDHIGYWKPYNRGQDPRAIVHVDYETAFIQLASVLGMTAVKSSDEILLDTRDLLNV